MLLNDVSLLIVLSILNNFNYFKLKFGDFLNVGQFNFCFMFLFLPFYTAVPSEICIEVPKSPLNAVLNQTAIIPVEIQVPKSDWDFIEVLWHHTKGIPEDDFILKYDRRSCNANSSSQLWWKRECHLFLEVMPTHQRKMSALMNAWLIIWNIEAKDAGRYQVTVKSNNIKEACSFVELRVTEDKRQ